MRRFSRPLRTSKWTPAQALTSLGDNVARLRRLCVEPGEREVTYWIGRSYWGRGIATGALSAFLVGDPSRLLHARVAHDNVGSRRVLEKRGFRVIASEQNFAEARSAEIDRGWADEPGATGFERATSGVTGRAELFGADPRQGTRGLSEAPSERRTRSARRRWGTARSKVSAGA